MLQPPKERFGISTKQALSSLSLRVRDCNLKHLHKRYTPWFVFQDERISSIYTVRHSREQAPQSKS